MNCSSWWDSSEQEIDFSKLQSKEEKKQCSTEMKSKMQRFKSLNNRDAFHSTLFQNKGAINAVLAANEAKVAAHAFLAKNEAEKMRLGLTDDVVAFASQRRSKLFVRA